MSLSLAKIRADPYAKRLALLGETTITDPVSNVTTTPIVDLEGLQSLVAQCVFAYGSAGESADFFIQTSFDAGTTWQDVAAFRFPGVTGRLATDFDGTNDAYSRGAGLTGAADGKLGTVSAWFRIDGGIGADTFVLINTGATMRLLLSAAAKMQVLAKQPTGGFVLNITSSLVLAASATWHHVICSWDLGNTTACIYVDDGNAVLTIPTNANIDQTDTNWHIGASAPGIPKWNGALAELYFALEYLDLSVTANRRKFISAAGHPVPLGADGSTPTGTQPIIYARDGDASNNLGSGGDFTAVASPTSVPGPNVEDTRFQAIKSTIATAANQSNQDGAMDPNSILDGVLGSQLRVKYSTLGTFAGGTTIKIDAIARG